MQLTSPIKIASSLASLLTIDYLLNRKASFVNLKDRIAITAIKLHQLGTIVVFTIGTQEEITFSLQKYIITGAIAAIVLKGSSIIFSKIAPTLKYERSFTQKTNLITRFALAGLWTLSYHTFRKMTFLYTLEKSLLQAASKNFAI